MKIRVLIFIIFTMLIYTNTDAFDHIEENYHFAISGGASLGVYEAGVCLALMRNLNENSENDRKLIGSFSGSSAGAINALLSAIEYLKGIQPVKDYSISNDVFFKSWDVDIDELLTHKPKLENELSINTPGEGIFSRNVVLSKLKHIKDQLDTLSFQEGREISLAFSASKNYADKIKLETLSSATNQDHYLLRHHYVFIVFAEVLGGKVIFRNFDPKKIPESYRDICLSLPEDEKGAVSFSEISKVVLASGAFPMAFSPVELSYKYKDSSLKKDWFSDGGMFDNAMVGVAKFLAERNAQKASIVYIDPNISTDESFEETDEKIKNISFGIEDYIKYLFSSFNVARSTIHYSNLKELEDELYKNDDLKFYRTKRTFPLMGTFDSNFAAFYSKDFRLHDFLVGVYDGMKGQLEIQGHEYEKGSEYYLFDKLDKFKSELLSSESDPENKTASEYLDYLYNREFGNGAISSSFEEGKTKNKLIAISKTLKEITESIQDSNKKQIKLESVLDKLKLYKSKGDDEVVFSPDTLMLINRYNYWRADFEKKVCQRVIEMQKQADSSKENREMKMSDVLVPLEPYVRSLVHNVNTKIWPLRYEINDQISSTLVYSYDVFTLMNKIAGKLRYAPFRGGFTEHFSIDLSASYDWLQSSNYEYKYLYNIFVGPTYHTNNIALPTITLGYKYSFNGSYYEDDLHFIQGEVGILNELFGLGFAQQCDSDWFGTFPTQLYISVDILQVALIISKSFSK